MAGLGLPLYAQTPPSRPNLRLTLLPDLSYNVWPADFDRDGRTDLVAATASGSLAARLPADLVIRHRPRRRDVSSGSLARARGPPARCRRLQRRRLRGHRHSRRGRDRRSAGTNGRDVRAAAPGGCHELPAPGSESLGLRRGLRRRWPPRHPRARVVRHAEALSREWRPHVSARGRALHSRGRISAGRRHERRFQRRWPPGPRGGEPAGNRRLHQYRRGLLQPDRDCRRRRSRTSRRGI